MTELPQERLGIGVLSCAGAEWMFEETKEYINTRKAFGRTLADLQTIQHKMAEMKTAIAVCRSFVDQCIQLHDERLLSNEQASMAKYWASDLENKVAYECVQLHGGDLTKNFGKCVISWYSYLPSGWGYMWETPIARAFANARVQTIYGGANEIMKELIARSIVNKKRK